MKRIFILFCFIFFLSCSTGHKQNVPVVGFLDLLQDETLSEAKRGFFDALSESGFDEHHQSIKILYRNAQGDQPSLAQACDYLIAQNVDVLATSPTLSTITAVQKTKTIPIFMMVSPRPDLMRLTDKDGNYPENLFGVYETLDYIDTSMMIIKQIFPNAKRIGVIYNQSEPQSVDALNQIKISCVKEGFELVSKPVTNSNETQLVVESLINEKIDAFFALPDNIVFSSFELIAKICDNNAIPVFTSEEGLVKRGALAAFGADMYQWGFQSGKQASFYLKNKSLRGIVPMIVIKRRKVYNKGLAEIVYKIKFDSTFTAVQ